MILKSFKKSEPKKQERQVRIRREYGDDSLVRDRIVVTPLGSDAFYEEENGNGGLTAKVKRAVSSSSKYLDDVAGKVKSGVNPIKKKSETKTEINNKKTSPSMKNRNFKVKPHFVSGLVQKKKDAMKLVAGLTKGAKQNRQFSKTSYPTTSSGATVTIQNDMPNKRKSTTCKKDKIRLFAFKKKKEYINDRVYVKELDRKIAVTKACAYVMAGMGYLSTTKNIYFDSAVFNPIQMVVDNVMWAIEGAVDEPVISTMFLLPVLALFYKKFNLKVERKAYMIKIISQRRQKSEMVK